MKKESAEHRQNIEELSLFLENIIANETFDQISHDQLRRVMTAAVRLYAQKAEVDEVKPAIVDNAVTTPTEAVVVVTELLHALDINLFDLAMWYRRPETGHLAGEP